MSRMPTLAELLAGHAEPPAELAALPIAGLSLDSRAIGRGDAFVALAGTRSHGLQHAAEAGRRGAACVLFEPPAPGDIVLPPNALPVASLRKRLGAIADRFHDTPSAALTLVGVTGTNGKTSTVHLLAQALERIGRGPCGTIGTLGVGLSGRLEPGERTTPDVISVHATLARLRERGARAVAMEVSSHALEQGRVDAVRFDLAVFTNLSRDHLDYHRDMDSYGAAKAKLFAWPGLQATIVNIDDPFGCSLQTSLSAAGDVDRWTTGSHGAARLCADGIVLDSGGLRFTLCEGEHRIEIRSDLFGRFNVDNLLVVAACLRALDVPLATVATTLPLLQPVPGRMQRVAGPVDAPRVVVDYAHTPDALEQSLASLRAHVDARLICVFGCGGERDRGKRPQMAAIAERLADRVIVTDDNPRSEDGDAIVAEIVAGFSAPEQVRVRRDRGSAIADAIGAAAGGDIVLIAGKGHESYQEISGRRLPFDDVDVARRCLEARA